MEGKLHFFFQEIHFGTEVATYWLNRWADNILLRNGSQTRSAEVALCFNTCPGNIVTSGADEEGHWLAAVL